MVNPKARTIISIFTAQMQTNNENSYNKCKYNLSSRKALVLTELIIVIIIFALMAGLAGMNFPGLVRKRQFEQKAYEFIDIIKKAQAASAEGGKRYALSLDLEEQSYTLKEFTQPYFEIIDDDEQTPTMHKGYFTEQCYLDYVIFDDGYDSRYPPEGEQTYIVHFFSGRSGWDFGGNIVLIDSDGHPYSIVLNRLSRTVQLLPGEDYEVLQPVYKNELPF
jgi:type II secretory pathway pseudopilin PulG